MALTAGSNKTRDSWIRNAYQNILGRAADQSGYDSWYRSGLGSQAAIEAALKASPEGRARAVNATLYQDPAYAAYIRRMQASQRELENRRLADTDRMRAMEGITYGRIDYNERNALRDTADRHAGRGTFRSSIRLRDEAQQSAEYGRQRNEFALAQAQKAGDMQAQYSQQMDQLSRDRDEYEIGTRQRLFDRDAKGYYSG